MEPVFRFPNPGQQQDRVRVAAGGDIALFGIACRDLRRRRSQLRLGLNVPYLLLVLAFVVFDAIQTIRLGGTVHVPGGVGPGDGWGSPARC